MIGWRLLLVYILFLTCHPSSTWLIVFTVAIGHSTNLIGQDSNVIVVRGGNRFGRPVYQQILNALEEFYPDSGTLENGKPTDARKAPPLAEGPGP